MKLVNILSLSILTAMASTTTSAIELGEFDGTTFSVGGYVKAEGIFSKPDDDDNFFEGSARQSRVNFTAARTIDGHKVKGFIESDFWDNSTAASGDSTYGMRLRHAYIAVDNLTVGQTWNGQFFSSAPFDVESINFFGAGMGTIGGGGGIVRPDLVLHYRTNGLLLTAQDPAFSDASYPDISVGYTKRTESGHAFNVSASGREVGAGTAGDQGKFGAAISLAAKLKLSANTKLAVSAFTGEGAGVYAGWGYDGEKGPGSKDYDPTTGDLITTTGFSTGISHKFNSKLRGNIRYGQLTASEVTPGMDDTYKQSNANLIYTYLPNLDLGIELRDQNMRIRPPHANGSSNRPAGKQIELMAMYKF